MWLRCLVTGLLSRRTRFHPRPVHVGKGIGKVTLGHTGSSDSIPDQSTGDMYRTNWHWGSVFCSRPVYVGFLFDKLTIGQRILSRPVRMGLVLKKLALGNRIPSYTSLSGSCVRQTGTAAADSILGQSTWDACRTKWH